MTCLYPNFSEAKDHPQQHKIIHSNTLTTSKDIISFLVDEGTSAYQVSCCSQKSVTWYNPPFLSHYFSREKNENLQVADF